MKRDYEHRTVASRGSAVAPRVPGTGPPVIVIPGSLRTDADYAALAAALAARYEVHILKRRGPGGGRDPRTAYRLEDDRDDVLALLDDKSDLQDL